MPEGWTRNLHGLGQRRSEVGQIVCDACGSPASTTRDMQNLSQRWPTVSAASSHARPPLRAAPR